MTHAGNVIAAVLAPAALALAACDQPSQPTAPLVPVDIVTVIQGSIGTENWVGQSVTLPAGMYRNLRFHWYSFEGSPTAFGTLFVLNSEYFDLPSGLSSAFGLVARSERIENGEYVLPADLKLTGSRKYWFFADTLGRFSHSFNADIYPGGDFYVATTPFIRFHRIVADGFAGVVPPVFVDANFRLRGTRSAW